MCSKALIPGPTFPELFRQGLIPGPSSPNAVWYLALVQLPRESSAKSKRSRALQADPAGPCRGFLMPGFYFWSNRPKSLKQGCWLTVSWSRTLPTSPSSSDASWFLSWVRPVQMFRVSYPSSKWSRCSEGLIPGPGDLELCSIGCCPKSSCKTNRDLAAGHF